MKKRLIPFWLTPSSWFSSGTARKIAEIEYYGDDEVDIKLQKAEILKLTRFDIDIEKNDILFEAGRITEYRWKQDSYDIHLQHGKIIKEQYNIETLQLKYEYKVITEKEYDSQLVELMPDGADKKIAALDYMFKYHEITEKEYNKEIHTINSEPWFDFDMIYNKETSDIELSFDYNEFFWKKLKEDGHPGMNEDEIIDNFIRDWGRKLVDDEYNEMPEDFKLTQPVSEIQSDTGLLKLHK